MASRRRRPRREEILYGRWVLRSLFRESGYWYGRVRDMATGKIRRQSSHERDKRKARQAIIDWIAQLNERADGCERIAFVEAFKEWVGLKTLRPPSKRDLDYALRVYTPAFGESDVERVLPRHIETFLAQLATAKRSPRTRQKHLSILRGFFTWARRRGYTTVDPTDGLRVSRVEHRESVVLSVEQARILVASARATYKVRVEEKRRGRKYSQQRKPEPHLWLAILVAFQTALRLRNVLGLRWDHVDFDRKAIDIPGEEMKSHRRHKIPLHPELAEVLKQMRAEREAAKKADDGLVLGTQLAEIKRSFKGVVLRAGLPKETRWHDLRHTVASWLAAREPWGVVQRLLGHRAPKPTGLYVDLEWAPLVRAIAALPWLTENTSKQEDK